MKKYLSCLVLMLFVGLGGCKKGDDDALPTYAPPNWEKDDTGKYPLSMTAVVQLPYDLQENASQEDQLAAFIKGECRGTGEPVKVGGKPVFFVLIQGNDSDQGNVVFKYYSAKSAYLYTSVNFPEFIIDGNYGTADTPAILDLQPSE